MPLVFRLKSHVNDCHAHAAKQADGRVRQGSMGPALATASVSDDPDDPAVWIHASVPERSLILGTNKAPAPNGALVVFGLDGKVRQTLAGIDRPNNVDVEYGLMLQGQATDIAVLT